MTRNKLKINPGGIAISASIRKQEHLLGRVIRRDLRSGKFLSQTSLSASSGIESRSGRIVLSEQSQAAREVGWVRSPCRVSRTHDRGVQVGVHVDGVIVDVPGTAKRALTDDGRRDGRVGGHEAAVVHVGAVVVCEGGVRTLPGDDAAAAVAE